MVSLTSADRQMLDDPSSAMAMRIVSGMAEVVGAERLMDISGAHIDSSLYMGAATLEFAERLAEAGAKVKVPTTLNVAGVDETGWREWAVPPDWAEMARRQMAAYEAMDCAPTWTCAPYQVGPRPSFGEQVAWGESNAIVFANSVLGARTERYPDLLDICAAITGRVPEAGLHLTENRAAQLLLRLVDVPEDLQGADEFYPVLGFLVGQLAEDRIPCIDGLAVKPSETQLKALGAAAASSGAVALFHIPGVTPEAADLEAAFQGHAPVRDLPISLQQLQTARRQLTTSDGSGVELVVLGSPHFSLEEFRSLEPLINGRQRHAQVMFLITTSRAMAALAEREGLLQALREFGGKLTLDTCILTTPMLPPEVKTLMTNSAKFAYYSPGLLNTQVVFGSLSDCVESAVRGEVLRDDSLWQM